ncbi:hypothetical protein EYZ11_011277 [Aspergillus tanneri]|nr:hypothetical protein EYZ11_011277 [Aspergillus tanneri]
MTRAQNKILAQLVNRYGPSFVKLEFMAYDLDAEGAMALSTKCRHSLRYLALLFEHQHIRDGEMRRSVWLHPAPCSAAWNLLIGVGESKHIGISGLETLILERSGITPWQLTMLVKKNRRLKVLKLRTCRGAQPDFLTWLGGVKKDSTDESVVDSDLVVPGRKLEVLWLENCHDVLTHPVESGYLPDEVCDLGLEWVRGLTNLKAGLL